MSDRWIMTWEMGKGAKGRKRCDEKREKDLPR